MLKFLFIDDHAVVRASFTKILSEPFKPVEVEEAGNGDDAIEKIKNNKFDLVIMDVQMPQTDTLGLVEFIKNYSPDTKILMLSMAPENIHAKRYLKAGANGYISKEAPLEEVTKAIDLVLNGRSYISNNLADIIIRGTLGKSKTDNPFENLSKREYEIVTLLLRGMSVGDISRLLNVATSTIGTHKARVLQKLNVSNVIELKDLAAVHNI